MDSKALALVPPGLLKHIQNSVSAGFMKPNAENSIKDIFVEKVGLISRMHVGTRYNMV